MAHGPAHTDADAYTAFLSAKGIRPVASGFEVGELPAALKPFQAAVVRWACRRGKAAVFAGTGLGKTLMQLAWADVVARHTGRPVLILTPLAVARQTVQEAAKFGIRGCADRKRFRSR